MKLWLLILFSFALTFLANAQPKLGLTLSGGGAKGLAHIGILEAIDSAGLRVDAITGTSMGSILGSLYAAGYTGKEIEKIAHDMDWNFLFSGRPSIRTVNIDEKTEFDNYAIEVPYSEGRLRIGSGIIEGQELWLKFQELFLPIYDIKDFSKFSIPFRCVATDIATGKAVVLDQGELVTAIRASMAIPSIFTPIDYKDTRLIDGGIVRNFPVRDVKDMGAEFVIGVNMSQGLLPSKELKSVIDILYQIGFYKDADDFEHEKELCNVLIEPPVAKFTAGSFSSADSIISVGKKTGLKYYPVFKRIADSLRSIYPDYKPIPKRLPQTTHVVVDSIRITGLKHTTNTSFKNRLALEPGKRYNGKEVANGIRRVYGSRNYDRIAYEWHPLQPPGHATLAFNVTERPLTTFKAGIHYHTYSNVALILAGESKNLIFDRSKSSAKINISENFRLLLEHNQLFGTKDNNNIILSFYHETFKFPVYENFKQNNLYRSRLTNADIKLQRTFGFSSAIGLGTTLENFRLKPKLVKDVSFQGGNTYMETYIYYKHNTLNKRNFSTRGWYIEGKIGSVYGQHPTAISITNGTALEKSDTLDLHSYVTFKLKAENFLSLSKRFTLMTQFNVAINFNGTNAYLNFFNVGGINDFVRNQVPFTGLPENAVNTNSIGVFMMGLQYQLTRSLYTTVRSNVAVYNFRNEQQMSFEKYLSGVGVSVGYDSGIGPLSITAMYNGQSDKIYGYVNIGFPFR
ncbi:MAG: patatin-like phospholipase family protein [Chryseolinea sp.]